MKPPERPLRFAEQEDLRKARNRRLRSFGLICVVCVVGGMILAVARFFTIAHVTCTVEGTACDSTLQAASQSLLHHKMWGDVSVPTTLLAVKTVRIWPNTVRVQFSKPELLITFTPSNPSVAPFSLTKTKRIVSFVGNATGYPPIHDVELETKRIGDAVSDTRFDFYEQLTQILKNKPSIPIQSITVTDADTVSFVLDQGTIAMASMQHIDTQLQTLEVLVSSSVIDRHGKTIDLRFENPIVQ